MSKTERARAFFASFAGGTVAFLTNRLTLIYVGITAIYWTVAMFVSGPDLIEGLGLVAITTMIVAACAWAVPTIRHLKTGNFGGVAQAMVGIVMFLASTVLMRGWAQVWRFLDYPAWMVASPWLGFFLLWSIVSAVQMITAPQSQIPEADAKPENVVRILVAVLALMAGVAIGVFMSKPDAPIQSGAAAHITPAR